ncbi:MAG: ribonuclease HII, partial [Streptosporangiaceae bacterium]
VAPGVTCLAGAELARRPVGYTPRRDAGLAGYERVLARAGLGPVAGIDEAGRGACAGPLVVAAVVLTGPDGRGDFPGLADSKALTPRARRNAYERIVRIALAWHVVVIPPAEIDRLGLHVCNVAGMRRALAGLGVDAGYVLTDGFEVPGLPAPALAMWKADQVAGCVAAASIIAKVTRDTIMEAEHERHPEYGFAQHKGYSTAGHLAALDAHGLSPLHRRSFVNVASRMTRPGEDTDVGPDGGGHDADAGSAAYLDAALDSPMVELTADSLARAPGRGARPAARPTASSEGRT